MRVVLHEPEKECWALLGASQTEQNAIENFAKGLSYGDIILNVRIKQRGDFSIVYCERKNGTPIKRTKHGQLAIAGTTDLDKQEINDMSGTREFTFLGCEELKHKRAVLLQAAGSDS